MPEQVTFDLTRAAWIKVQRLSRHRDEEVYKTVAHLVNEGLRTVANRARGARSLNEKLTPEQRAANARKGGLAKAARAAERTNTTEETDAD
jgi:hypothetical protein